MQISFFAFTFGLCLLVLLLFMRFSDLKNNSVGGHVKRTLWQMGSQMGISVNLIQLFVFICPFQIFRKISFGCFGNPRVNLIR